MKLFLLLCISFGAVASQSTDWSVWSTLCGAAIEKACSANETIEAVGPWGGEVQKLNDCKTTNLTINGTQIWGVSYRTCKAYCSDLGSTFNFVDFANSLLNWLLPWWALAAQLPYESEGPFNNVEGLLLAVGSPAFITYSLVITMANRFRVAERFEILFKLARDPLVKKHYPHLTSRLHDARYILQESQQAPMRATDSSVWLSALLMGKKNGEWWSSTRRDLENTRRGVTTSLVVQLLFAVISWLFTVIAAFAQLGNPSTALSISSSSLWIWMIPVCSGWVAVGTQGRRKAIANALENTAYPSSKIDSPEEGKGTPEPMVQDGISTRSGINPSGDLPLVLLRSPKITDRDATRDSQNTLAEAGVGLHLPGSPDALSLNSFFRSSRVSVNQGHSPSSTTPLYIVPKGTTIPHNRNSDEVRDYADGPANASDISQRQRLHHVDSFEVTDETPTFWSFSLNGDEGIEGPVYNYARVFTFSRFTESIENGFAHSLRKIKRGLSPTEPLDDDASEFDNLATPKQSLSAFCGFNKPLLAYPEFDEISAKVRRDMFVAGLLAIFVQWGTSGPSIMIGFLTPTTGVGCRSASYVIYAATSTIVWLLLMATSVMSNALMLRYQRTRKHPSGLLPAVFVITRLLGKLLAAANAAWLVITTIFELGGIFDTCWCNSDFLSLGSKGWVLLFVTLGELAPRAQAYWTGGIVFVAIVCILASAFVWLGCRRNT